jgi:hypothetical protein
MEAFMSRGIPDKLSDLIKEMIGDSPTTRPQDMGVVLTRLQSIRGARDRGITNILKRFWQSAR